jgi:hypothetical protein
MMIYPPEKMLSQRGVQLYFYFSKLCKFSSPFKNLVLDAGTRSDTLQKYFLWLYLYRGYKFSTCLSYFTHITNLLSACIDIPVRQESFWTSPIIKFIKSHCVRRSAPRLRIPWCIFVYLVSCKHLDPINNFEDVLYLTVLSWSIFGLFRVGELLPRTQTSISMPKICDISVYNIDKNCNLTLLTLNYYLLKNVNAKNLIIKFQLLHSKARKKEVTLWISAIPSLGYLCPVYLFIRYLSFRVLFSRPCPYLFISSSDTLFTYSAFNHRTHCLLTSILPSNPLISLHHTGRGYGFRLLQCCSAPHWLILALGRWLDTNAYLAYVTITIKDIIIWQKKMGIAALEESNSLLSHLSLLHNSSVNSIQNTFTKLNIQHSFYLSTPSNACIFEESQKPISIIFQ